YTRTSSGKSWITNSSLRARARGVSVVFFMPSPFWCKTLLFAASDCSFKRTLIPFVSLTGVSFYFRSQAYMTSVALKRNSYSRQKLDAIGSSTFRAPASARTPGDPTSTIEAILPSRSISTADGTEPVPNSGATSCSRSCRNRDLKFLLASSIASASPEATNTSRGAPFGGFSSQRVTSSDKPRQNGHAGSQ